MFDIGFWELLVIALVLLLVIGPERLPEVAKQGAFLIRKARNGLFKLRNEMKSELDGTPFEDLQKARQEIADFKNDIKQFGRDMADSADTGMTEIKKKIEVTETSEANAVLKESGAIEPDEPNKADVESKLK